MNKFLNTLVAIMLMVCMMATAREGSFSGGGYSSSSSYSPSYSSDWGSSSSSSSDWGGSSSSSWSGSSSSSSWSWGSDDDDDDDDDDYSYSSRSNWSNNSGNTRVRVYRAPHDPKTCPRCNPKYHLHDLYGIKDTKMVAYFLNHCSAEDKAVWSNTLCNSATACHKGEEPAMSDAVKDFIKHLNDMKPEYEAYVKKREAEEQEMFKNIFAFFILPMITLLVLVISYGCHNTKD